MSSCSSSTATFRQPPGRRAARECGGALHSAPFARKPRGGPAGLGKGYRPALQLLLRGGRLPQAHDPAIAALSRPQGLSRHGRDVDLGDAARGDSQHAWRACRACRGSIAGPLRAGVHGGVRPSPPARSRRSPWPPSCRRSTSPACRPRCSIALPAALPSKAHRLAAVPRAVDRRRIGDARFLTGGVDPQRMLVAGHRHGAYRRPADFVGERTWRSEADRGCMSAGRSCASR